MIDFQNPEHIRLHETKDDFSKITGPILIDGEEVEACYKSVRDGIVFTNKSMIVISVEGVTGKRKNITSLPYSKIQTFSVETSGVFDLDTHLDLRFSGLGKVLLEFSGHTDVKKVCRLISNHAL